MKPEFLLSIHMWAETSGAKRPAGQCPEASLGRWIGPCASELAVGTGMGICWPGIASNEAGISNPNPYVGRDQWREEARWTVCRGQFGPLDRTMRQRIGRRHGNGNLLAGDSL